MVRWVLPALALLAVHVSGAVAAPPPAGPMHAPAPTPAPMRTIVRIGGPTGDEIWSRIRGQTIDLDVALVRVADAAEPALSGQLDAATRLARAHRARVVVWLRPLPDQPGLAVHVVEPAADRLFVRRVPQREPGLAARSATIEAAALVVRSALRALAAGTPIGVSARTLVAAEERAHAPPSRWHLAARWQAALDGARRAGHHGLAARVGFGRGSWQAHATLATHPRVTIADERAALRVARHDATVGMSWGWRAGGLRIAAALDAGVAVYTRATDPLDDGVAAAAPSLVPALCIRPGARVHLPVLAAGLFVELEAAADVLLGAPEFVYQRDGLLEPHTRLWPVQPRASLGLMWEF